ncbi:hypothetical protein CNEO4_990007 [Clostridium neonatale]|nr:hypothetical protein CNEO4_990007 [Clostridium neonatale]
MVNPGVKNDVIPKIIATNTSLVIQPKILLFEVFLFSSI